MLFGFCVFMHACMCVPNLVCVCVYACFLFLCMHLHFVDSAYATNFIFKGYII